MEQILSQEEVFEKYTNLVKFAAKKVSESTAVKSYMGTEDLYQEGMVLLYNCYNKYNNKTLNEFGWIFKSIIFRHLAIVAKCKENDPNQYTADVTEAYDLGYDDVKMEDIFMEYGMKQLLELLKYDYIALAILEELLNPSERTLWEMEMDKKRKVMIKSQGVNINLVDTCDIKLCHIRRALELTSSQFDNGLDRLREQARAIFGKKFRLQA